MAYFYFKKNQLNKIFFPSFQLIAKVLAETWDELLLYAKAYDKLLTWQNPWVDK